MRRSKRRQLFRSYSRWQIDLVGSGMAASSALPGGNVTGLSLAPDLAGKRLEALRQLLPDVRRLAILGNAGYPAAVVEMVDLQATQPHPPARQNAGRFCAGIFNVVIVMFVQSRT